MAKFTQDRMFEMLGDISKTKKPVYKQVSYLYADGGALSKFAGGGLLTKKVTCESCGWKWDAADGGNDVTTCHKCGGQGLVHAQDGGESGCPEGYYYNGKICVKVPRNAFATSDPDEYAFRKAAYDDSLWMHQNNKRNPWLWKALKHKKNGNWLQNAIAWSADETISNKKNFTLTPQQFEKGYKAKIKKDVITRFSNNTGITSLANALYDQDHPTYNSFYYREPYVLTQEAIEFDSAHSPIRRNNPSIPFNEPISYLGKKATYTDNLNQSGERVGYIETRYKKPVQPVVYDGSDKKPVKVQKKVVSKQDSPTTRTVYIDCPPGSVSNDEKTEVITNDPDSPGNYLRTITTGCKPEKIENLQLLKPSIIDPTKYQLQGNTLNEEVESEYLEEGSPDTENAMEWVDKRKYNIDWNGKQIPYRLPRFRKLGSYGDLIKPGKKRYINLPTIESRNTAYLREKEYGGLYKFVDGGPTSCPIGQHWDGVKCVLDYEPYSPYKQVANNALTNNVSGVNAQIAETQRKGMAYQSTADELNVLNKQQEKLKADEAKRNSLEAQERQRQQQLRTVGSDNTRVDSSIIKNSSVNFQLPYEQAQTITKAQKDAARQIVTNGDFGNYFPEQMNYYLSKENSHRQGGPLTLEELALQQIRTNPDFFQSLEEKKYQDFQKREQKAYDEMPWYMKGVNTINALASDPLTTLERGLLEFERPLAFQGLQSTDPSDNGEDARFYDRALNRDENVLNNTLNYINPFRAASSAGQNLQQGDYGAAAFDAATIVPMLKGAKAGWKGFTGFNNALNTGINTGLTNAGASSLVQGAKAGWRAPLPLGKTITNATAGSLTSGAALGLGFGIHGALNEPENLNRFITNPNIDTGVELGISTLEMLTSPGMGNAIKFGVKGVKDLAKLFSTDSKSAFVTDDVVLDLESQIAKLKEQQVLTEESVQILMSDYKAGKISAEEYKSLYKELDPNKLLDSKVELETILREYKVKQDIANTPQQNILKSEEQLGKNISDGGINNKGVFEVGDKYVARLSAHGYDDASRLVKYADKIKSPRIAKTLQVKELNGNVYQVQQKVTGTPLASLTKTELQNIPKEHINNFLKDKAELEELGLWIDISGGKSNILYNSKKGFQFIDLGISPVGKNMMESNDIFVQTYKGLNLPSSPSSFSPTSINVADTGAPLDRFIEKKYLSKAEAEALKLANPQMKTQLIKKAEIKGTTLPERFPMTIEGQQQAFDDATDFALNWGLKDADAYNAIHSDFVAKSQRHSDLTKEISQYISSTKYKEIDQKYKDINDAIVTEFLSINNINKNDLINYQADEILYHNKRIAEILAENSERSIDLQRGEAYRKKIGKLESEKQQLAHDLQLLHESKESLIDPTFKEKVQNLYREAGASENQIPQNAFYGDRGYAIKDFGKDRMKLVEMNQLNPLSEPSFAELSDADQMTLANDWEKMSGVRTNDATITLQSKINDYYHTERTAPKTTYTTRYEPAKEWHPLKPWTWKNYNSVGKHIREVNREPYIDEPILIERLEKIRENPTELAGVNAHEIGHDYQKFFQNWGRLITEYDPKKAYQSSHSKNKLAKRFQDAMVKGKNLTKDELKKGDHKTETWLSSPNELHSELMKARYNVYNKFKAEQPEISQRDIINWIKKSEASGDDNIFDLYIYALNPHFKPETTNAERKALIKLLPALIPAAGSGVIEGMDNEMPQNKYGGNVKTLSKFIKK